MDRSAPAVPTAASRGTNGTRTRKNILLAASAIFAEKGFSGANVNEIVVQAGTTKPMLYYHFGSKEGLFAAVLEEVYAGMRAIEDSLHLESLPPLEAMRRLVEVTFDYHAAHPDWIRLIADENIHGGQHIVDAPSIPPRNATVVDIVQTLLARGVAQGVFRAGIEPLHLHMLMASFSFYRVSNRHTWRIIFQRDLSAPEDAALQKTMLVEAVLRFLKPD